MQSEEQGHGPGGERRTPAPGAGTKQGKQKVGDREHHPCWVVREKAVEKLRLKGFSEADEQSNIIERSCQPVQWVFGGSLHLPL